MPEKRAACGQAPEYDLDKVYKKCKIKKAPQYACYAHGMCWSVGGCKILLKRWCFQRAFQRGLPEVSTRALPCVLLERRTKQEGSGELLPGRGGGGLNLCLSLETSRAKEEPFQSNWAMEKGLVHISDLKVSNVYRSLAATCSIGVNLETVTRGWRV